MSTPPPSDDVVLTTLRSTFGYTSFRPLQQEIVRSMLAGEDVFVLMPTGGGKSLCYQLPALLGDGFTVVVSPLIALMKDQVDALHGLGVAATFINSSLPAAEVGRRQAALDRGQLKLLYLAPERLMAPGFLAFLSALPVARFVIDESHCISEWGHDFRPEYRELRRLRALFPSAPLGAFTATATRHVQADIVDQLGLYAAATFRGGFNRSNLLYQVRSKEGAYEKLTGYLKGHEHASGIIYCQSRADTTALALQLKADGFDAAAYHAGLESDERRRRQEAFIRDDTPIIVATIAFGLGIDKPDVRFVVHYDLPKSLEGYYQESGRAGRDGQPSDCILFYSYRDVAKLEYFIEQKPEPERRVARQQLRRMVEWAQSAVCRRRVLLSYFDEPFDGQTGPCCDVCDQPQDLADCTIPAQMLLSCAKRTGERFGMAYLIDVLRGSRSERVVRYRHDKLPTHGIGRDRSAQDWQEIGRQLVQAGYIHRSEDEFPTITVTERGHAVLFKKERVFLAIRPTEQPGMDRAARSTAVADEALFETLRTLRKRLSDERGVPPYVVFHDTTLRQMAAALPTTRAQLLRIEGVGERKLQDYGEAFLACIAAHVGLDGQRESARPSAARPGTARLGASPARTLELFREGLAPADIAASRQLAISTVEGHLAEAIETGEPVELERLVSKQKQAAIEQAIGDLGPSLMRPIKELLGDDYTYDEIRIVRAALARAEPRGREIG
jgi:ATP-dependent DNA helicase RecQ